MGSIRYSKLMIAALLAMPACDDGGAKDDAAQAGEAEADKAERSGEADQAEPVKKKDPWQERLEGRVLADSGLGVGGKLSAFQIINGESGEEYCQVCKYGPNPKVMAVGEATDEAFKEDLRNLDAIVAKYGEDKLKAFAVVTDFEGGKAVTPEDPEAAKAKAKALKEELRISMPIVVPAPEDGGANRVWDEYYNITASRTIMFADGRNEVKYSGVAPSDFADLAKAIESTIEG